MQRRSRRKARVSSPAWSYVLKSPSRRNRCRRAATSSLRRRPPSRHQRRRGANAIATSFVRLRSRPARSLRLRHCHHPSQCASGARRNSGTTGARSTSVRRGSHRPRCLTTRRCFDPREPAHRRRRPGRLSAAHRAAAPPAMVAASAPPPIRIKPVVSRRRCGSETTRPSGYRRLRDAPRSRIRATTSGVSHQGRGSGHTPRLSPLQWKLAGAAALVIAVGAGAVARPYLIDRPQPQAVVARETPRPRLESPRRSPAARSPWSHSRPAPRCCSTARPRARLR